MNHLRNKVQLIGNLGKNPEIYNFESGTTKASFSIATKEVRKKENGEYATETQWHNIVAWGNVAKIAEKILEKGSEVAIDGKLTSRSYEDKDGNKRFITEIIVNELMLINAKKKKKLLHKNNKASALGKAGNF